MTKGLCSVGLDVGTTTTQLVVSRLDVENKASAFAVPEMVISRREVVYQSPVHFTPMLDERRVDGEGIRRLVEAEYRAAGITRDKVDTGAVIITGETSRKENARAVLDALAELAGDFVVATAGPDLESVLAAKGAGATEESRRTGQRMLHMDIGGGTANLALIEDGLVIATGCMNVGGRLVRHENGRSTYVSPVLKKLCKLNVGDPFDETAALSLSKLLAQGLEEIAGLTPLSSLGETLWTAEAAGSPEDFARLCTQKSLTLSFSGGVADCMEKPLPWDSFGDIGPSLGQAITQSRLCAGSYRLGEHTIRATVIGAGSHSAQLSGSTVFHRNAGLPIQNIPVAAITAREQTLPPAELEALIRRRLAMLDGPGFLALPGLSGYENIRTLAQVILRAFGTTPIRVALEQDMAKALGQILALQLGSNAPILCLDSIRAEAGSYLDVGKPVGPALQVVVKTLVLGK